MKRKARLLILAATIIAIILLGLVFIRNLIDFPVYYSAGRSLLSGRDDLYAPDFAQGQVMDYRYPPFFLVALFPLWVLPYSIAAYIWYLISILEISGCIFIIHREARLSRSSKIAWIIISLAVAQYFVMILHYGNAHLLAVVLLFSSFYFVSRQNNGIGALAMALAITIKLTPILILPYFALKRKWKFLSLMTALLVAINLAPSAYFGMTKNAQLIKSWYEHVIADQRFHEMNGPINLSLKGELRRYFSQVDYSERVDGDTRYPSINIAAFSSSTIELTWMAVASIIYLGILAIIWVGLKKSSAEQKKPPDKDSPKKNEAPADCKDAVMLEISLMIGGMLLVEPLTSKIYFIALLWPVASLAAFAFNYSTRAARHAKLVLVFVAAVNFVLPLLPGRSVQRVLLVLGADFYLSCLLMMTAVYALIALRREARQLSGEPQIRDLSAAKTS